MTNIDFSRYTHINYAFAILPTGDTPQWTDDWAVQSQLPTLVQAAHAKNAKVLISVGGWSGCVTFGTMAASAASRANFIKWNVDQIKQYNTDGVDLDWEYPGRQGAGCNAVDLANDANNYLQLIKELREALQANFNTTKEITIAAHVQTFDTPSGKMKDVSAFADALDRINIMTYDINGAFNSTSGPNAPLNFEPGHGDADSFVSGIQNWLKAGVPASKIAPGLAFYGRSASKSSSRLSFSSSLYSSRILLSLSLLCSCHGGHD